VNVDRGQLVGRCFKDIATVVGMGLHEFAPVSGRTARGRGKNEGTNLRIHAD
jgi:hypothetical protein